MIQIKQITVKDLKKKMDAKESFKLVDVREKEEYEICRIEGSTLISLSEFQSQFKSHLKPEDQIIVHCHHGGRSQQACEFLAANGFKNVANVSGGIHAWACEIDSKVKQY